MLPSLREQHLSGGRAVNGCEVLPAQPSQLADVIVCDVKVLKILERENGGGPVFKGFFVLFLASACVPLPTVSTMLMHGFHKPCVIYKHGSNNDKSGQYKKSM